MSKKQLHEAMVAYLGAHVSDIGPEAFTAQHSLAEAFGITLLSSNNKETLPLLEIFREGLKVVQQTEGDAQFMQFIAQLQEQDFFKGAYEGTEAHAERMCKARAKYLERVGGKSAPAAAPAPEKAQVAAEAAEVEAKARELNAAAAADAATATAWKPVAVSAEDEKRAEDVKGKGNQALQAKDAALAASLYTDAHELNPNSAIYLGNRAAAYMTLKKYDEAVDDCLAAIARDASYAKAHSRLGSAYAALGQLDDAVASFERCLELDAGNKVAEAGLAEAKKKRDAPVQRPATGGSAGGAGGAGGLPFDLGNMDLGAMMQNPAIMDMAKNMMSNPGMMQNMMNSMGMGGMMPPGGFGGAGAGAGAAAPAAEIDDGSGDDGDLYDDAEDTPAAAAGGAAADPIPGVGDALAGVKAKYAGNAKVMAALAECERDPSAVLKFMSDPELSAVAQDIMRSIGAGGQA